VIPAPLTVAKVSHLNVLVVDGKLTHPSLHSERSSLSLPLSLSP
jgi:hypothetical protein